MNFRHSFKNQISALLIFTTFALTFSSCKKDNLEETSLDASQSLALKDGISSAVLATGITADSYYLVNSLPAGYVKDGSVDYTTYVQAAVTKYSNIVFPGFPILVNDKGIIVGSNKTITFEEGSELRLKGTLTGYSILKLENVSNITLYNPVIVGDRDTHLALDGEHGMGIGMWGASDVSIYNPKITNCWGDGIYLGQAGGTINCKNIVIKDAYLYKNRRDGVSIIGVDGLLMENTYVGYTDGTLPMTGINIEPNNEYSEIKNVRILNPRTENNGKNGIQVTIRRMLGSTDKYTDITIVNHVDIGSPRFPFKVSCSPGIEVTGKMHGVIDIINPSWQKTALETDTYLWLGTNQPNLKTVVSSPEIINITGSILSWTDTYNKIMKMAGGGSLTVTQGDLSPIAEPSTTSDVVFAINAGGSAFTASNGITYSADKNYTGGSILKSTNAIGTTTDDALYQSERYGNFSYAIPVADGTYDVTFKLAEVYFTAAGKRQFDVLAENTEVISNLDIFSQAGGNSPHDIVKTVTVSDGTLNLNFKSDINYAKISAFHVVKKSLTTTPVIEPDPVITPEPDPIITPEPDPVITPEPDPIVTPEPDPVVTPEPEPVITPEPEPIIILDPIFPEPVITPVPVITAPTSFAVNAGGASFTASNGITYSEDKGFSGGTVAKSSKAINNTTDDVLYQSARYGTFTYAVPLADGTYEITFRFAETLLKGAGKRQFDILAENSLLISNLDIFKQAGSNTAYDVTKTVTVTDGVLNLNFNTDINGAAVSAFRIVKK